MGKHVYLTIWQVILCHLWPYYVLIASFKLFGRYNNNNNNNNWFICLVIRHTKDRKTSY